ncbi:MAG: hypothetical protein ACOY32_14940 [Thermodesulfobacteriota bacterium]
MDPASLIPAADALPVHWPLLQFLLTLTTFLHLVAMNVLLGGGVLAFVSSLSRQEADRLLSRDLAGVLPYLLAFTVNFGVAPLLFLQTLYGQFFYTSTVLMAVYWLAIVGLLIIAYYGAYLFLLKFDALRHLRPFVIGLVCLLLLGISFFFTNNISIMQVVESWPGYFANRNGWLVNGADPTLLPRYLHFVLSGIAVGSLAVAVYSDFRHRNGDTAAVLRISLGCRWFAVATGLNFGVGFWFLGTLPSAAHDTSTPAGILFAVTLYGSVATGALSIIKAMTGRVRSAALWTLITVFFMVVARDMVRIASLSPFLSLSELPVVPQYSPFLVFCLLFIAIGLLVRWMVRLVWRMEEMRS